MIVDIHSHYGQWLSTSHADTPERFAGLLDRFEIGATICSSGRAVQYEIVSGNAEVAELMKTDPRIYGAIVVNPNHYDASVAELDRYRRNDRFLAAKLHPDYCGLSADCQSSMAVIRKVSEAGLPLFLHTWSAAQVDAAAAVARAFPDLPVFMFHMGGSAWRAAIARAKEHSNLYMEIVSTVPEAERITEAVRNVAPERVFFGTDMTLLTPAYALGLVDSAGLQEREKEMVMGLNARRFFRLP